MSNRQPKKTLHAKTQPRGTPLLNFRASSDIRADLDYLARRTGLSTSDVIREAIRAAAQRERERDASLS